MCGQGTFRFFSRNMKAVHLYLSLSFLCQTVCLVIVIVYFFAFKCGWKSTWIKKKYLCMCGCSPNVEKIFETGW